MNSNKFYNQLTMEQKRKLRTELDKVKSLRKKQVDIFDRTLIQPIKNQINNIDRVRHNDLSINNYIKHTEKFNTYMNKWFRTFGGENGSEEVKKRVHNKGKEGTVRTKKS